MKFRYRIIAAGLVAAVAAAAPAVGRAEPPAGSKNFNPPTAAPNYFSNESGPVLQQPAPLPVARPVEPAPAPAAAAPAPAPRPRAVAGDKSRRHVIRMVKSRDRGRTAHTQARAADKRRTVAAGSNKTIVKTVAKTDGPRSAKLAHAEPHSPKTRAAAKGQRTRAADRRAGHG